MIGVAVCKERSNIPCFELHVLFFFFRKIIEIFFIYWEMSVYETDWMVGLCAVVLKVMYLQVHVVQTTLGID